MSNVPIDDPAGVPIDSDPLDVVVSDREWIESLEAENKALVAAIKSAYGWLLRRVVCHPRDELLAVLIEWGHDVDLWKPKRGG